jgi:hypothetical protein
MIWGTGSRNRWYRASVWVLASTVVLALGCRDDPTPPSAAEEEILLPGLNVYLTVDEAAATPGATVRVTAKARAVGVKLTPTGYVVRLRYDPERLEVLADASPDDDVLRVMNLAVGPGLVKAAGAAPDGLGTDILFVVDMKVRKAGYSEGLGVEIQELTVLERNFADLAPSALVAPRPVVVPRH